MSNQCVCMWFNPMWLTSQRKQLMRPMPLRLSQGQGLGWGMHCHNRESSTCVYICHFPLHYWHVPSDSMWQRQQLTCKEAKSAMVSLYAVTQCLHPVFLIQSLFSLPSPFCLPPTLHPHPSCPPPLLPETTDHLGIEFMGKDSFLILHLHDCMFHTGTTWCCVDYLHTVHA